MASPDTAPKLPRVLGFWALVAYGVGDILGAGIYALTGEIAAVAGRLSWVAFAIALFIAGLTALSYAELAGRYPRSGGEAKYCEEGFRSKRLAFFIGWLVMCSGVLSMATVSHAFAGYLLDAAGGTSFWAQRLLAAGFLVAIAWINFRGMRATSRFNILSTMIEASGLILVLVVGIVFLAGSGAPDSTPRESTVGMTAILQATLLAFFVFIGFEDMANVAEEVKNPGRTLPAAIVTVVAVTGVLYLLVIWVATNVVSPEVLGQSDAPLLEVIRRAAPGIPPILFTAIALFAVGNTGLLNSVTTSRLLYGMSNQQLLPRWFGRLHPDRHTPHRAIGVIFLISAALALTGTLGFLGGATSALILCVFLAVNLALVAVRLRDRNPAGSGFRVPLVIPLIAAALSLALIGFASAESMLRAGVLAAAGIVFALLHDRWRGRATSAQ